MFLEFMTDHMRFLTAWVVFNMLAFSVEDHEFGSLLGQNKDYKNGICCFSAKHTELRN